MTTSIPKPAQQPQQIQPSPTEAIFFGHLNDFVREGRLHVEPKIPATECRIAGGWVRDKLLGLPSHDLDVTLSSCAGYPFAQAFVEYLRSVPSAESIEITSIGKVSANPEQSKHLETATTRILGLECDFVQLRSEVYADGSRIPSEVRIGTPLEDAERRDITINTLFYNVHTQSVEDWTGKGMDDLANHRIRTPLPPLQTFYDDPLRILRCLRFASRFGYALDKELTECLGDETLMESLRTRISRERVGIEVEKMIKGPNPLLAIELITNLNLYPHIFVIPTAKPSNDPKDFFPAPYPISDALLGGQILTSIMSGNLRSHVHPALFAKLNERKLHAIWLAIALLPYRRGLLKEKKKDITMAEVVIRDGIKLGNAEREAVARLYAAHEKLSPPAFHSHEPERLRSGLGLILREVYINDPATDTAWTNALVFSMIMDLLPHVQLGDIQANERVLEVMKRYYDYTAKVEELGLGSAIEEKPRIDGNELNATLGLKPSQLTKYLMLEVVRWQLDNPSGTAEDCKAFLLKSQAEGTLPTMESLGLGVPANKKRRRD